MTYFHTRNNRVLMTTIKRPWLYCNRVVNIGVQVEQATKDDAPSKKVIDELKTEVDNLKRLVTKQVAG